MARGGRGKRYASERLPAMWRPGPLRLGWLAARRIRRGGAPLAAVSLGMLIAVALLCAVPLYINLGGNAQLQSALHGPAPDVNIEVTVDVPGSTQHTGDTAISIIQQAAPAILHQIAPTTSSYLVGPHLFLDSINAQPVGVADGTIEGDYVQPLAYDLPSLRARMRLFAGRLPATGTPGGALEVLATPESKLNVGDLIATSILGVNSGSLTLRVVGVWFPQQPDDPYWNGRSFLAPQTTGNPPPPTIYPLLTSPAAYYAALAPLGQSSPAMTVHSVFYTQPERLTTDNIAAVAKGLIQFRTALGVSLISGGVSGPHGVTSNINIITRLPDLIATLQQQFTLSDLPLYIVIVQVVGLALVFVLAMASLLVESQASEIAVLKSRGASDAQTLGALTASGALPAVVALLAGPVLAAALTLLLIRLGIPGTEALVARDASAGALMRVAFTPTALLVAAVGVILGLAALALPAWQAARFDVLTYRLEQARPTVVPLWRRYYLDLALAGFCAVGYLELSQFGGLDVRALLTQAGAGTPTLLLLLAPALLLLAGGLVLLRVIPLLLAWGFQRAARARGAVGMLAFAQLSRGAARFSRLTLLLTLAVAMGLFALTFQSSLGRNAADRASYQTGGDVRVWLDSGIQNTPLTIREEKNIPALPGVTAATGITRTTAQTPNSEGNRQIPVIGIDPATFASAAYWRDDYADQPLSTLLAGMRGHLAGAVAGQASSPIWALISPDFAQALNLRPGQTFLLVGQFDSTVSTHFVVGGVVRSFPTVFDSDSGYLVVDSGDLVAASANTFFFAPPVNGPGEYWLRVNNSPSDATARALAYTDSDYFVGSVTTRRDLEARFQNDPVAAGMTALLLAGALLVACLAVLGGLVQAAGSARQRVTQFAILRTLGTSRGELTNMFLLEQLVMYVFGMLGGLLLGLALSIATLPYLEFGTLLTDSAPPGIPPYLLVVNVRGVLLFFGALALAFALGLLWQRQVAMRVVLDHALRLGED